jgi:hypothetical protein
MKNVPIYKFKKPTTMLQIIYYIERFKVPTVLMVMFNVTFVDLCYMKFDFNVISNTPPY